MSEAAISGAIIEAQTSPPLFPLNSSSIMWGLKILIDLRMCPMVTADYGLDGFPALFIGEGWLLVKMDGSELADAWYRIHSA